MRLAHCRDDKIRAAPDGYGSMQALTETGVHDVIFYV